MSDIVCTTCGNRLGNNETGVQIAVCDVCGKNIVLIDDVKTWENVKTGFRGIAKFKSTKMRETLDVLLLEAYNNGDKLDLTDEDKESIKAIRRFKHMNEFGIDCYNGLMHFMTKFDFDDDFKFKFLEEYFDLGDYQLEKPDEGTCIWDWYGTGYITVRDRIILTRLAQLKYGDDYKNKLLDIAKPYVEDTFKKRKQGILISCAVALVTLIGVIILCKMLNAPNELFIVLFLLMIIVIAALFILPTDDITCQILRNMRNGDIRFLRKAEEFDKADWDTSN